MRALILFVFALGGCAQDVPVDTATGALPKGASSAEAATSITDEATDGDEDAETPCVIYISSPGSGICPGCEKTRDPREKDFYFQPEHLAKCDVHYLANWDEVKASGVPYIPYVIINGVPTARDLAAMAKAVNAQ